MKSTVVDENLSSTTKVWFQRRVYLLLDTIFMISGHTEDNAKIGPNNGLTAVEEDYIITYILTMAKIGYPVSKPEVLDKIKNIINHNGRPILGWIHEVSQEGDIYMTTPFNYKAEIQDNPSTAGEMV